MALQRAPIAARGAQRIVFKIPGFTEFGEILHDRLHGILYHIEELTGKFMLITNFFDREFERIARLEAEGVMNLEALIYAGTIRQRQILERDKPLYYIKRLKAQGRQWDKEAWLAKRDANWLELLNRPIPADMEKVDTFDFFEEFRQGKVDEHSIKIGNLRDYFAALDNILQENEYPIVSDYFDIEKDKYIGIPILGMGLFQGIVWIIFPDELTKKLSKPSRIRRVMKLFQMEYDNLAMNWDIKGDNITRESLFRLAVAQVKPENDIQTYINIKKYYEISAYYHQERVKQNDSVLARVREQHLQTAIITILLDSYAHNISAHSLTTLSYWFRERAEFQHEEGRELIKQLGRDNNPIITYTKLFPNRSLARELYPLFKFLLEKGAFWSGITRQTNFTGKVSSMYNVLWYDFVNNPLYLGTIANTEKVLKVHLNITIFEREERPEGELFKNKKIVKKNAQGVPLDGTFASVNLVNFSPIQPLDEKSDSPFVEKGTLYEELSAELKTYRAYFPGGVIGKHAFFTLLENEIRNVKHYRGKTLADIQRNGLILNLSIHTRPINSEANRLSPEPELFKVGVWLKHPADITENLLIRRIQGLDADIVIEESFRPKLGGNFQDKICASVLIMSAFNKVQSQSSAIGKIYYPWIKTASYRIRKDQSVLQEFEVSHRKYKATADSAFEASFKSEAGQGYLKKYFHIWRGAEILDVSNSEQKVEDPDLDSSARYHFVYLAPQIQDKHRSLKASGLIRIIMDAVQPRSRAEAYQVWLKSWLKTKEESCVLDFRQGDTLVGRIIYTPESIRFFNETQVADQDMDDDAYVRYLAIPTRLNINIEHGSHPSVAPDKLNYRSTGELINRFCQGKSMDKLEAMPVADCYELFEGLISRICIFDRRIYNRLYTGDQGVIANDNKEVADKLALQRARLDLYREELHLDFQNEVHDSFDAIRNKGFMHYHFVVLHLSFIEGMQKLNGKPGETYREDGIVEFIDDHILKGETAENVADNFILIITTGRGRMAWWEKIRENEAYANFTTFRPIESILGAVEDALQKPDDIDLKYNLVKLFFGS